MCVGMQFGDTLAMKEEKKLHFVFLHLHSLGCPQATQLSPTNTPTAVFSELRRENKVGKNKENQTLQRKVYSPLLDN